MRFIPKLFHELFVSERRYRVLTLWARLAYARYFDQVAVFCLFVGYPRSGHSIVGAMLNSHRDAVIAHEADAPRYILDGCSKQKLFSRILARAAWFHWMKEQGAYSYAVPGQWQGRFATLRVLGDKRAGMATRAMDAHPDFLDRTRALVGVPLRLIHVVRNPFDNIATISRRHHVSREESISFYFRHAEINQRLRQTLGRDEMMTVYHEQFIQDPRGVLSGLCAFLGLAEYPGYLDDCVSVVFKEPTYSRRQVNWTAAAIAEVEQRLKDIPFLAGYAYEIPAPAPNDFRAPSAGLKLAETKG